MNEQSKFSVDDQVYILAFLDKKHKNTFFLCCAKVLSIPQDKNSLYKVQITAVGDRSVGGPPTDDGIVLLGRTVSKKLNELHTEVSSWWKPGGFIEVVKE